MRSNTNLRPIFGLIFCGMLLIAPSVGGLSPAAAFGGFGGGFGRMGGFGPRAGIHPGARKPMMTQRRGTAVSTGPQGRTAETSPIRAVAGQHIMGLSAAAAGAATTGAKAAVTATTAAVAAECRRAESGVLSLTK